MYDVVKSRKRRLLKIFRKVILTYGLTIFTMLLLWVYFMAWKEANRYGWLDGDLIQNVFRITEHFVMNVLIKHWVIFAVLIATFFLTFFALGIRWMAKILARVLW